MVYEVNNVYSSIAAHEDTTHQAISSYFLGPQGENLNRFKENLDIILEEQRYVRETYFPQDGVWLQHFPLSLA